MINHDDYFPAETFEVSLPKLPCRVKVDETEDSQPIPDLKVKYLVINGVIVYD